MNIRIATRKSKLALWQAEFVKKALETAHPDVSCSLVEIVTEGDRQQNTLLANIGGKALFVKALQTALLTNEADIAVHSIKDMSVTKTDGLILAATLKREDPSDAFVSKKYLDFLSLPENAIVGTSSPRRACLIKSLRQDIVIKPLRGNVGTRLSKLDAGEFDGIVLASAGLKRLGLSSRITEYFDTQLVTPAIGQGAIGVECRENDINMRKILSVLHDEKTGLCVATERALNRILGGDCHTAIGAHATLVNDQLTLSAMIGSEDGKTILRAATHTHLNDGLWLADKVAQDLLKQGAEQLIHKP